jgi:hypothetical protein
MGTPLVVALLFAVGTAAWAYAQLARQTGGGNARNAVIGAGVAAVIVFIFFYTLFTMVIKLD